jgi:hypothetical protein
VKKLSFGDSQTMSDFKRVDAGLPQPVLSEQTSLSSAAFYK